ncbi:hypothetical protein [Bradyrhizobium sp.]
MVNAVRREDGLAVAALVARWLAVVVLVDPRDQKVVQVIDQQQ